jgi:RNA polymerase sigma-70 factor (ECF subfamily)
MDLEDVFRSHQRELLAYFVRVAGDRQDAEELTQETFLRACSAALRYRGDAPVRAWLFGIARRVLWEAARAGLFERTQELPDAQRRRLTTTNAWTSNGSSRRSRSSTERCSCW